MKKLPYLLAAALSTQSNVFLAEPQHQLQYRFKSRNEHILDATTSDYDVIIVGGGATGAAVALDCGLRGLKSVVLESYDFASGASSKSTKLIHGGVRYLQQVFEFKERNRLEKLKLVAESLRERSNFMQLCGYLTRDFPTLIPCSNFFWLGYYYFGSLLYHMIYLYYSEKGSYQFKPPRIVFSDEISRNFPSAKCSYGVLYYDGQFNDSRMVQDVLLTASLQGQNIINYVEVKRLLKNEAGKITGVTVLDKVAERQFDIKGKVVVNATGCYADNLRLLDNPNAQKRIIPVGGSHIILPQKYGSRQWGYLIPKTSDGRVMYILPWLGNVMVGTTEKKLSEVTNNPTVDQSELTWLINEYCREFGTDTVQAVKDVKSKWCGIRPLVVEDGAEDTKEVSRTHVIEVTPSGLVSVMGGKWTIFRLMGEQCMDKVCEMLSLQGRRSDYKGMKLVGDAGLDWENEVKKFVSAFGVPELYANYYLSTYGQRGYDVFKFIQSKDEYLAQLHPKFPHTVGEVVYQIRFEQACSPEDILLRRTRMGFLDQSSMFEVYERLVKIFAEEMSWDAKRTLEYAKANFQHIRKLEF